MDRIDSLRAILREELGQLSAYAPALRPDIEVHLDANEAPPCTDARIRDAVQAAVANVPLERYPDASATQLKAAISRVTGARPEELFIGSGSDEVIALLLLAFGRPRDRRPQATILAPTPTFVMYRVSARGHGIKPIEVPLDAAWDLDLRAMLRAVEMMQPNIVFLASPNNPTGNRPSEERVQALVDAAPDALVVVDEAYVDYANGHSRGLRAKHGNVAIMRTVSKLGLAALRVGWLEADAALVAELDKVRQPFNVSATSQAAVAAVLDGAWDAVQAHVGTVRAERDRLSRELQAMAGVSTIPSEANFLWVRTERPAEAVFGGLAERKILVRSFHERGGRLANQLRITVGTPTENDRLLEALRACAA
jgi:histidinol-phosphate aminotransferase